MTSKICNACKIAKTLDNFNTKPGRNGQRRYNYICKFCQSEKTKQKNKNIKNATKIKTDQKACGNCKIPQPASFFTKISTSLTD